MKDNKLIYIIAVILFAAFIFAIIAYAQPDLKRADISVPRKSAENSVSAPQLSSFWEQFKVTRRHAPPKPFPEAVFKDNQGRVVNLLEDKPYRGRYLLINFWALWCPPCIEELPSLQALQKKRGGDDFDVVVISLDYPDDIAEHKDKMAAAGLEGLNTLYARDQDIWDQLSIAGLPTTILLNKDGAILYSLAGEADWDSAAARQALEDILDKS